MQNIDVRSYDDLISELAGLYGIVHEYWDIFGNRHETSSDTKKAILRSMRIGIDSIDDLVSAIGKKKKEKWHEMIAPVFVFPVSAQPLRIPIRVSTDENSRINISLSMTIEDEFGREYGFKTSGEDLNIFEETDIDGEKFIGAVISPDTRFDIGYYWLLFEYMRKSNQENVPDTLIKKKVRLIITPESCYIPKRLIEGRTWGLAVNLYSLRSEKNWGVGDFGDLRKVIKGIGKLKGGFVGINPLHALSNEKPYGISPYCPLTRLYKNIVYLDMEKIPDIQASEVASRFMETKSFRTRLDRLKKSRQIDYEGAASLKTRVLRYAFEHFLEHVYPKNVKRSISFREFIREEGCELETFALFLALRERMIEERGLYGWHEWSHEFHDPHGNAVAEFKEKHQKDILYFMYLQWLIDGQLRDIGKEAANAGMCVGIYHDLAIGSSGAGHDAWVHKDVMAADTELGAPPDDFNPQGQKWGFPPMIPEKMRKTGYELFIQTIRKNMKHCGALRIDHALGMFRMFWVPSVGAASDGAYVTYPAEDLLGIIALESERSKTMIIAEDLGTIGENVRESLKKFGMLSYRLFYFERNYPDPSFMSPEKYPELSLSSVTTHDLPTLYGYWAGRDIEIKKRLGIYKDTEQCELDITARERDKMLIIEALKSKDILKTDFQADEKKMTPELCSAIYEYMALTSSKMVLVSLDDVVGTTDQQNLPGTVDEHPNWMQKTPLRIEDITQDRRLYDMAKMFEKRGR